MHITQVCVISVGNSAAGRLSQDHDRNLRQCQCWLCPGQLRSPEAHIPERGPHQTMSGLRHPAHAWIHHCQRAEESQDAGLLWQLGVRLQRVEKELQT